MKLIQLVKQVHNELRAKISKQLRTKEVVRVLSAAHAQELAATNIELWPTTIQRHKERIAAVMAGKLDIVDRRSWQWPYLPESLHRLQTPILKNVSYNSRRFSETPIPRRAINLIKNSIVMSLRWEVRPVDNTEDIDSEMQKRIDIATHVLKHPNRQDSYRTFWEKVVEDIIMGGYGCIEPRTTPDYNRPLLLYPVDGSSIRLYANWTESTSDVVPKYAQQTGLKGERGIIAFYDRELIYIRDNSRSSTPFGLGKMEIAFNVVNYFLGAIDMGGKAASDQIHKTMLWWQANQQNANLQTVRRYIQNELEGQAKVSIISGMQEPKVIDINPVKPEDLLLDWQQFLIKIIGQAFDISPISLGVDRDVNKATGRVMADSDFYSAVVPMAKRIEDAITYEILHKRLKWTDLEFHYLGLEDPDQLTKKTIQQRDWSMGAITPDEVRKGDGRQPIPGGWGKLTFPMVQILIAQATAMARGQAGGQGAGGTGMGSTGMGSTGMAMPGGGSGAGFGMSVGNGGSNMGIGAGAFSTDDIANMTPEDIGWLQEQGLLPETDELGNQMEDQQPGILQTLTQQLKEFFEVIDEYEEEGSIDKKPSKITNKDKKEQLNKFKKDQHTPTYQEKVLNRRYSATDEKDRTNRAKKRIPLERLNQ